MWEEGRRQLVRGILEEQALPSLLLGAWPGAPAHTQWMGLAPVLDLPQGSGWAAILP